MKKPFCIFLILFILPFIIGCSPKRSGFPGVFTGVEVDGIHYKVYADKTDDMVVILAATPNIKFGMKERVQKHIFEQISRLPIVFFDGKEFSYDKNALYIITKLDGKLNISKREINPSRMQDYPEKDWNPDEVIIYDAVFSFEQNEK